MYVYMTVCALRAVRIIILWNDFSKYTDDEASQHVCIHVPCQSGQSSCPRDLLVGTLRF